MKVLVTGATGFVGSAVARLLLEEGREVRVLVRPRSSRKNLEGLDVEVAEGDLRDRTSIDRAVKGCSGLFHVAADYRLWVPDPENMHSVNVNGTVNVMRAAMDAGVERVVYTSSVATLGTRKDGRPADESTPSTIDDMIGHYKKTKFLAERAVRELVEKEGLDAVIVNPSTPVGPGDIKPTPTGRLIVNALTGRMPAYVDTGLNIVHVDDVARGHLLAFEKGKSGERYILGGQNMTLCEILEELASIAESTPPRIRLPHALVISLACASEAWARLTRSGEPMVTLDGARMSKKKMYFSSKKAESALGYSAGPARKALEDAVMWFRENGYCP